ncbi:hypothetical protein QE152_g5588 [Popillia japonica]|uniref:Uncharacterized protein n=1 Tax=Popillia japonica TaxID=7064 RepID=A0AAW1MM24_POPJA
MNKSRARKTEKTLVNSKNCKNKAIKIAANDFETEKELGNDNDDKNKEFGEIQNLEFNNEEKLESKGENKMHA